MSFIQRFTSPENSVDLLLQEPTCPKLNSEKYLQDLKSSGNSRNEYVSALLKAKREQKSSHIPLRNTSQPLDIVTPAKHLQVMPPLGFSSTKYHGSSTKSGTSLDLKPLRVRKSSQESASDSGTFNDKLAQHSNSTFSSGSKEEKKPSLAVDGNKENASFNHESKDSTYTCSSFGDLMSKEKVDKEPEEICKNTGQVSSNSPSKCTSSYLRENLKPPERTSTTRIIPTPSRELLKSSDLPVQPVSDGVVPVHECENPGLILSQSQTPVEKSVDGTTTLKQSELRKLAKASTYRICVNGHLYQVMGVLGDGGSSKVYDVYNAESKLRAIKIVDLKSADKSVRTNYLNETAVLHRLQHSHRVVKLYDHEFNDEQKVLYVVMERGDIDLATFLIANSKQGSITPEMVKFYWSEMLRAVQVIHNAGIIHSDLKPSNFLLVAGQLKLIDFGIASTISHNETSIIKETRAGTPSYMSPEAFMDICSDENRENVKIKIGVKSDVWSLGCILYHMVYGHTPLHEVRDPIKKMFMIVNPQININFPPIQDHLLLDVLKRCIVRDVKSRASIEELLNHPYLKKNATQKPHLESIIDSLSDLSPSSINKVSQVLSQLKKAQ